MRAYRDVLRRRRFRLLWVGDTLSSLGDAIGFLALVWLVYSTDGSAATLGGFLAVYTAPVLIGGPLAGAALDRVDRRRLMLGDNLLRGGLVASSRSCTRPGRSGSGTCTRSPSSTAC